MMALYKGTDRVKGAGSTPPKDTAGAVPPKAVTPRKMAKRIYSKAVGGGARQMKRGNKR